MISTIDSAGRLVVPKELREALGLSGGIAASTSWRRVCCSAPGLSPIPRPGTVISTACPPNSSRSSLRAVCASCGIDTPSIDPFEDKHLATHQAVAACDMAVLEGLVLAHVTPGRYVLVALPLRLTGADASPVRAALWCEAD